MSRSTKNLSEWVPKIIKKPTKSKPGPHRVRPCALQCPRIVPGSSQHRPRIAPGSSQGPPGRQSRGAKQPNNNHGQQNPPEINRNPGLDLKVSFVILSSFKKAKDAKMTSWCTKKCQDPLATMPRICNPRMQMSGAGGRGRSP